MPSLDCEALEKAAKKRTASRLDSIGTMVTTSPGGIEDVKTIMGMSASGLNQIDDCKTKSAAASVVDRNELFTSASSFHRANEMLLTATMNLRGSRGEQSLLEKRLRQRGISQGDLICPQIKANREPRKTIGELLSGEAS